MFMKYGQSPADPGMRLDFNAILMPDSRSGL